MLSLFSVGETHVFEEAVANRNRSTFQGTKAPALHSIEVLSQPPECYDIGHDLSRSR